MTFQSRAPQEVRTYPVPLPRPEPFKADYGPCRAEMLRYIDENTDQRELAGGEPGQHFEW